MPGAATVLMPSTPCSYSQVVSRDFASLRALKSDIAAGQRDLYVWFDSRQLHRLESGRKYNS
jgi:hypothetical protein